MTALNYTADYPIDAMGFRLEGMAFDGCHYYFSVFCDNIILKYNSAAVALCNSRGVIIIKLFA